MTRADDVDSDDSEGQDCNFYESLDRLASCSSATTSDSDSDLENAYNSRIHSSTNGAVPKFPMGVSKYDIWISEPEFSVEERRTRLLKQMGLNKDPTLTRVGPDFRKSVSSDQLTRTGLSIARSKSEGNSHLNNDSNAVPIELGNGVCVNNGSNSKHINHVVPVKCRNGESDNGSPVSNRPPTGKISKKMDEISMCECGNSNNNTDCGVVTLSKNEGSGDCDESDQMCTIKNLDTGKEFVVNEIREDGMWNKVKEVGTGKQLTMEEFEMTVGHSPIVQELMRRQNVKEGHKDNVELNGNCGDGSGSKVKKKGSWFKSIRNVASSVTGHKEKKSSDEKDTSSEKGGRRSSSATDDSQDVVFHGPERVRVRQYGKSCKELTAVYKSQEIHAHIGSIWSIKFSLDGRYLASAGEDRVIHIWQVVDSEKKGDLLMERSEDGNLNMLFLSNGSPEPLSPTVDNHPEKKRRGRSSLSRKSINWEPVVVPETVFGLAEKPVCSFKGHLDDVLDLSWSKSQHLLSSSMDKTVRLWHLSSNSCLKVFSHSDYVTCIQFNPVDDRYFISGSIDGKVRIWSIPDRQVVDWYDLHEMVTAACYTPDGQAALVGSYKGSCRLYNTAENKLQQKSQINLQNKKKKSHLKKITGFQFTPGSLSEVLVTSADSRIRVVDDGDLVHKFKGFHNTNSQISSSLTTNGKYVVSASEDSNVYVWKHEGDSRPSRNKGVTVTRSYEHFHCPDVSVAIPWPGILWGPQDISSVEQNRIENCLDGMLTANDPLTLVGDTNSPIHGILSTATNSYFNDRISATWPEEKLLLAATKNRNPHVSIDLSDGVTQNRLAWGMVIVTAGLRGEIRTFQNFGLPVRI